MNNSGLLQFHEAVDEEIKEYEEMEKLYRLKQAILISGKSDALWDIDAKIVDKVKKIKTLDSKRRETSRYLGSQELTMSEVIEKAKISNDAIAEKLQNQKSKLNILSNSISLYERTNMDLIKHGLNMAEKTMQFIISAVAPQPSQYNKTGKNVGGEKIELSSIVEEA